MDYDTNRTYIDNIEAINQINFTAEIDKLNKSLHLLESNLSAKLNDEEKKLYEQIVSTNHTILKYSTAKSFKQGIKFVVNILQDNSK